MGQMRIFYQNGGVSESEQSATVKSSQRPSRRVFSKVCGVCSAEFKSERPNARYCGKQCKSTAAKRRQRAKRDTLNLG